MLVPELVRLPIRHLGISGKKGSVSKISSKPVPYWKKLKALSKDIATVTVL